MATATIPFPFYMLATDGVTLVFVGDNPSYNAALGMGFTFPSTLPATATPINPQQPNATDLQVDLP